MQPPSLGDRSLFPDLVPRAYFNHAAISPPSLPVRAAVREVLDSYAGAGAAAAPRWIQHREELRGRIGRLIGAAPETIGLVPNTSHGVLTVAMCLPWRRGDRVVLLRGEFPANVTPWQRAAEVFGLEVVWLDAADFRRGIRGCGGATGGGDGAGTGLARLEAVLQRGARLVAVSAVQFQTGLRMPLRAMADLCHRFGAELFVDGIQALGAVPLDVTASGIDYLAAGAHKWLMGLEGAGLLYVAPARISALQPRLASWLSHEESTWFLFEGAGHLRYDRPIRHRADFVELGVTNVVGHAALHAALGILLDLGVERIWAWVQALLDPLEEGLEALGLASVRSIEPAERSCILSVTPPPGVALPELWRALGSAGVACASPDGYLRFSPHWHGAPSDVAFALEAVAACLRRLR